MKDKRDVRPVPYPISIPGPSVKVHYKEKVHVTFVESGTFTDSDPTAFTPRIPNKHYNMGDTFDTVADSHDHDDTYNFQPDNGAAPLIMRTIQIRNIRIDDGLLFPNPAEVVTAVEQAWERLFEKLSKVKKPEDASGIPLYKCGINNISVSVSFATFTISITVSGPESCT